MPNGLFNFPPIGSAFVVPNDSLAKANALFTDQAASLTCSSHHELILFVLDDFNMLRSVWETMTGNHFCEFMFIEVCATMI